MHPLTLLAFSLSFHYAIYFHLTLSLFLSLFVSLKHSISLLNPVPHRLFLSVFSFSPFCPLLFCLHPPSHLLTASFFLCLSPFPSLSLLNVHKHLSFLSASVTHSLSLISTRFMSSYQSSFTFHSKHLFLFPLSFSYL